MEKSEWALFLLLIVLVLIRFKVVAGNLMSDILLLCAMILLIPKENSFIYRVFTVRGRCIVAAILEMIAVILWII